MKLQRTLAPTAAPIPLGSLLFALSGIIPGRNHRDRLVQELKAKFSADDVFLVSSGKAALTVILKALAAANARRRVVIPAYTCFSVPSAIVRAGLEVVLCDVDPQTLDFDFGELQGLLKENVLCVLPTHLFGLTADAGRVKRMCEGKGIVVVEDAAQSMGASSDGALIGTIGDVAFFSLGRGKNLTSGTGGIILTKSSALSQAIAAEYAILPETPRSETLRNWVELLVMRFFIHPMLYWLPAGLPFLGLGETKFYTDFPICRMDNLRACQLRGWDQRLNRANRQRAACASRLIEELDLSQRDAQPITDADGVYLRLPVLVRNRESKEAVCRRSRELGAGLSPNYPTTIQEIPQLQGRIAVRACPGAQEIVDRLVTLPTHEFVNEQDRRKIEQILEAKTIPLSRRTEALEKSSEGRACSVPAK